MPQLHVADCPKTNTGADENTTCVCEHWDTPRYYTEGGGGAYKYPGVGTVRSAEDEPCPECDHYHFTGHPTHYPHEPHEGDLWRHYKGGLYKVLHLARHSEDKKAMVVYQCQKTARVWCRPYPMWRELIDPHSYHSAELDQGVEKGKIPRFTLVYAA